MHSFILQFFMFVSLGVIIYLIAQGFSRIEEEENYKDSDDSLDRVKRLKKRKDFILLEKADRIINFLLKKTFRRIKLVLMRIDFRLTKKIQGLSNKDKDDLKNDLTRR